MSGGREIEETFQWFSHFRRKFQETRVGLQEDEIGHKEEAGTSAYINLIRCTTIPISLSLTSIFGKQLGKVLVIDLAIIIRGC